MLSYNDSKRLKELGCPQELKEGDWVYRDIGTTDIDLGPQFASIYRDLIRDDRDADRTMEVGRYVKVPTTDGMIEGLVKSRQFEQIYWHPIGDLFEVVGYRNRYSGQPLEDERRKACEEEIDQVLCELWKKVKG